MSDTVSSAVVTTRIRQLVWPRLEEVGFETAGRAAWRAAPDRFDAVCFWAIGAYNGPIFDTVPASFKVQLGVALRYGPQTHSPEPHRPWPDDARPDPADCDLRRELRSRIASHKQDSGLWMLLADGSNVDAAVAAAAEALVEEGLPWFERFADAREVLRTLEQDEDDITGTWGPGRQGSPARQQLHQYTVEHLATLPD